MQTLGLFGDSFVQDHRWGEFMFHDVLKITNEDKLTNLLQQYKKAIPAWWELLHNYNATPHGVGGADNYCGLLNFLYNHEKYDRVIFLITESQRQSFWLEESKSSHNLTSDIHYSANNLNRWIHATSEAQCIDKQSSNEFYSVMKDFHATVGRADRVKGNILTNLIVEKVKKIRPDTLFINGFADNSEDILLEHLIEDFFEVKKGTPLLELHWIDNKKLGSWPNLVDMRISHQSTPSNTRLAKIIQMHLDTDKTLLEFDIEPFRHIKVDKNLVFVKSNNPESFKQHLDLLGVEL